MTTSRLCGTTRTGWPCHSIETRSQQHSQSRTSVRPTGEKKQAIVRPVTLVVAIDGVYDVTDGRTDGQFRTHTRSSVFIVCREREKAD